MRITSSAALLVSLMTVTPAGAETEFDRVFNPDGTPRTDNFLGNPFLNDLWEFDEGNQEIEESDTADDQNPPQQPERTGLGAAAARTFPDAPDAGRVPGYFGYNAYSAGYYNSPHLYESLRPDSEGSPFGVFLDAFFPLPENETPFIGLFGVYAVDPDLTNGSAGGVSSSGATVGGTPGGGGGLMLFTCPPGTGLAGQLVSNLAVC